MNKIKSTPKKRLFGRNLFTLIFAIVVLLVLVLGISITMSYVTTNNANKITPFVDKNTTEQFTEGTYNTDAKRINGKDFDEFGLIFKCNQYLDEDSKKTATYELRVFKTEDTKNITGSITANVCLAANWVGYASYATKSTSVKIAADEETALGSTAYRKTFTLSSLDDYPAKANTWPIKITVSEPTIYLYISYDYYENGKAKTDTYILKYSYSELTPLEGGIRN